MSAMSEDIYDEAIIDIVGPETMLSRPEIIKDIDIAHVTPRQLSYSAPFTLRGSTPRRFTYCVGRRVPQSLPGNTALGDSSRASNNSKQVRCASRI